MRQLVFISALTLYLQLVLIRYLGASIWNLGYFPNVVLLAAFTGLGIGFLLHSRIADRVSRTLFHLSPWVFTGLVALVVLWHPAVPSFQPLGAEVGGELFFSGGPGTNRIQTAVAFPLALGLVGIFFVLLGQRAAKLFRHPHPLTAYSFNLAGSCAGVVLFWLLAWQETPAYAWVVTAIPLFWLSLTEDPIRPPARAGIGFALLAAAGLIWSQDQQLVADPHGPRPSEVVWSPYQKLELVHLTGPAGPAAGRTVFVNGLNHQSLQSLASLPRSLYQIPYADRAARGLTPMKRVLVLGAGTGNDVAAALANGASRVDAVEIDPAIARWGLRFHPADPYQDPRVHLHIDDGRHFLNQASGPYDLILFALTDSIVKASPMGQIRLENYLFTREAVERARRLLAEKGEILFYNFYRQPWVAQKIAYLLQQATGVPPRALPLGGFTVVISEADPAANGASAVSVPPIEVPSDDWPFLYLPARGIPPLYRKALALLFPLLGGLILGSRACVGGSSNPWSLKASFFCLGLSFMLLESKSIVQLSLVFGTSWQNSSLVFLGVLLSALAANRLAPRFGKRHVPRLLAGLLAACLLQWILPLSFLLEIHATAARAGATVLVLFSPIFFANLIFSSLFQSSSVPQELLGCNLLGSTIGGILEYASMAVGYRALSLVLALGYLAAVLLALRGQRMVSRSSGLRALSALQV